MSSVEELLLSTSQPGVRARASLRETARRFALMRDELTHAMVDEIRVLAEIKSDTPEFNEPSWLTTHRMELKVSLNKMEQTLTRQSVRAMGGERGI